MILRTLSVFLISFLFFTSLSSCESEGGGQEDSKVQVLATTGIVGDIVQQVINLAGDSIANQLEVKSLMGPGVDPHLYKATQGDLSLLREADIIFYNGLHLEGKMQQVLEEVGRNKPTYALSDTLPERMLRELGEGVHDPHIWFDPRLIARSLDQVVAGLTQLMPQYNDKWIQASEIYRTQLLAIDDSTRALFSTVNPQQRVLVTAHDAFSYFGQAYDVDVRGLQGISSASDVGVRDIRDLVDFLLERKVKSIHVESSVPPKAIEQVKEAANERGHDVVVAGTLYSDALGGAGSGADTYIAMLKKNIATIYEGM